MVFSVSSLKNAEFCCCELIIKMKNKVYVWDRIKESQKKNESPLKSFLHTSRQRWYLRLLAVVSSALCFINPVLAQRRIDPTLLEEYCKNFTHGNPNALEFYSPMYPKEYPESIICFRTLTADFGYFIRVDFRDGFRIEPASNEGKCDYDYLEIRDGDQGYSPLIGKYCGDQFPPIITSSGRSLWMRFTSDNTIQYSGFKAAYRYIPNPLDNLPDIGKCSFEAGGHEVFIGTANISEDRLDHSRTYGTPIDCVWTIRAEKGFQIYLQFMEYHLIQPNDCHLNYIQVFDGKTDNEHMVKNFCGSVAESLTSKSNVVYVRFYAEKGGIDSEFRSVSTAMRPLEGPSESCDAVTEYDCDDANCIHPDLICNGIRNCKYGWDEESCVAPGSNIAMDFSSPHVIVILIALILILGGLCTGMIINLVRTLSEDQEEIAASREKSLAASSAVLNKSIMLETELPHHLQSHPPIIGRRPPLPSFPSSDEGPNGGCHVPDGEYPLNSRF